jgi:hypothetical protein
VARDGYRCEKHPVGLTLSGEFIDEMNRACPRYRCKCHNHVCDVGKLTFEWLNTEDKSLLKNWIGAFGATFRRENNTVVFKSVREGSPRSLHNGNGRRCRRFLSVQILRKNGRDCLVGQSYEMLSVDGHHDWVGTFTVMLFRKLASSVHGTNLHTMRIRFCKQGENDNAVIGDDAVIGNDDVIDDNDDNIEEIYPQ